MAKGVLMSFDCPVTHLFDFEHASERMRPYIMAEFAANGARNLVLTDTLIREVIKSPGFANGLHKDLESTGTRFVDSHVPFGAVEDLDLPLEDLRPAMLIRQKLALEVIADFGVDSITCHVGNTPDQFKEYSLEHLHDCILRSLDELLPVAERLGITIAIENIWFATNTPEKLLAIAAHFQSDNLGFCYDSGHANLMAKDSGIEKSHPAEAWQRFGPVPYDPEILEKMLPEITTCHLHDNNGVHDQHLLPGRGNIDWPHVIGLLQTAPRLKCIQNEVIPVRTGASIVDTCRVFGELLG